MSNQNNSKFQLDKKLLITVTLKTVTGLHVGGSNTELSIGGIDKAVIRDPLTNEPYIPGSSIKGKMRALIELRDGDLGKDNKACTTPGKPSSNLFGVNPDKKEDKNKQRPSRIIVRDARLTEYGKKILENADLHYSEVKTEVTINRITSEANPRQIERVPAGAEFEFEMIINIFEGADEPPETELRKTALSALNLLEDDYIGGNGSRGHGQIKITDIKEIEHDMAYYKDVSDLLKKIKENKTSNPPANAE